MMAWLFKRLGALPLPVNHALGCLAGCLAWLGSGRHRRLSRENVARFRKTPGAPAVSGLAVIIEQGKGLTEMAIAWTAPLPRIYSLVTSVEGWEHVDAAKQAGRPIIFVSPHLGCYDIAGRFLESRLPVMALYRPPKQAWLEPIMQAGRIRGEGSTAPADASGIRQLLRTLKAGGNIIMLPDQVPAPEQGGDGVWAPFFGTPAYTMTLLPRLARSTGAAVLFFFAERQPGGAGYRVHIAPPLPEFAEDKQVAAAQMNRAIEALVAKAPAQYLWGYNRYKHPAGAPLPPNGAPEAAA